MVENPADDSAPIATEDVDEPALRIGQSLIRLCVSLLDGRSRLVARGEPGTRADVWIPAAASPTKAGRVARRTAPSKGKPQPKTTKPRAAAKRPGG